MAYSPENNPYIPGDPYSYDLKWIVDELKKAISLYTPLSADFTALYNYVHDYFSGSDFEALVDEGLHKMAMDGTLRVVIQPLFDDYKIDIDAEIRNMLAMIAGQNEAITVLEERMSTFSSLPDGSTAGEAELEDIRIGGNGITYPSAGDAVRGQYLENKNAIKATNEIIDRIAIVDKNIFDPVTYTANKFLSLSGSSVIEVTSTSYCCTDYIPIENGETYSYPAISDLGIAAGRIFLYDVDKNFISEVDGIISGSIVSAVITNPTAKYCRANIRAADLNTYMFVKGSYPDTYIPYDQTLLDDAILSAGHVLSTNIKALNDVVDIAENLFNINSSENVNDYVLYPNGSAVNTVASFGWSYSHLIPVEYSKKYEYPTFPDLGTGQYRIYKYNAVGTSIGWAASTPIPGTDLASYVISDPSTAFVRIDYPTDADNIMFTISPYPAEYHPYNVFGILRSHSDGNVLFGKTIVTAGDSYTEAAYSGAYAAYNGKNYGYYIAQRNSMNFINDGISGSTMGVSDPNNPSFRSPFSVSRYTNIPDCDYLTIWFGINDSAHVPLGSIDDATNETFYGAWNVVLKYYLQNKPFMKIGIIIPTSTDNDAYQEAIREVATKWGYPYLDLHRNPYIPALFDKDGMSLEAQNLRRAAFGWNGPVPGHPSPQLHEYESTIIENFLRSI